MSLGVDVAAVSGGFMAPLDLFLMCYFLRSESSSSALVGCYCCLLGEDCDTLFWDSLNENESEETLQCRLVLVADLILLRLILVIVIIVLSVHSLILIIII